MDAKTLRTDLAQLEQAHKEAVAQVYRLEGAIAVLQQLIAREEATPPDAGNQDPDADQAVGGEVRE